MKRLAVILMFLSLSVLTYCQLLSFPFLNVENIELALTKPDQLREILVEHKFVNESVDPGKQGQPGIIRNPLVSNAETIQTEYWRTSYEKSGKSSDESDIIRSVSINVWKAGKGPHPDAIKSITIHISQDPIYADKVEAFFERIKDRYPIKRQRFIGNSELQREYSEPINVLANDNSKIEVRMSQGQIGPKSTYYIVSFDLVN